MKLDGHEQAIYAICLLHSYGLTGYLISASADCSIRVWNLKEGLIMHKLTEHNFVIKALSVSKEINN